LRQYAFTDGFEFTADLVQHFEDHRSDFPDIVSVREYAIRADSFLGGPMAESTRECIGVDDRILRYDEETDEFGALTHLREVTQSGEIREKLVIRTYMIPDPETHGYRTNYEYFVQQCRGQARRGAVR
jgi:hypothetical protein